MSEEPKETTSQESTVTEETKKEEFKLNFVQVDGKPYLVNEKGGVIPLNRKARRAIEAQEQKRKRAAAKGTLIVG